MAHIKCDVTVWNRHRLFSLTRTRMRTQQSRLAKIPSTTTTLGRRSDGHNAHIQRASNRPSTSSARQSQRQETPAAGATVVVTRGPWCVWRFDCWCKERETLCVPFFPCVCVCVCLRLQSISDDSDDTDNHRQATATSWCINPLADCLSTALHRIAIRSDPIQASERR